jgi:hypothetical protein
VASILAACKRFLPEEGARDADRRELEGFIKTAICGLCSADHYAR